MPRSRGAFTLLVVIATFAALLVGCGSGGGTNSSGGETASGSNTSSGGGKLRIAVIPKGTTHVFWKSVEKGARKAGEEMGAEILWKGPLKEDDRSQQIGVVQSFISDKVDGIILAPLDDVALAKPVAAAKSAGIPVVIFDSPLKGTAGNEFVSLVATDNKKAGALGAERLAKLLGEKGKVVLLRYAVGSASTQAREEGFMEKIKTYPGITVISDNQYSGATKSDAQNKALQMGDVLKQADGVFTPNESSTLGMVRALELSGLKGKLKFVGFDSSPELIEVLKAGGVDALVAQNPTKMGYEAVKTLISSKKGEKVEGNVDTGVAVLDKENLETPEIQALLGSR